MCIRWPLAQDGLEGLLEFVEGLLAVALPDGVLQAVLDVVVHDHLRRLTQRGLYSADLVQDVHIWLPGLGHFLDRADVAFDTGELGGDIGSAWVIMGHMQNIPFPPWGISEGSHHMNEL